MCPYQRPRQALPAPLRLHPPPQRCSSPSLLEGRRRRSCAQCCSRSRPRDRAFGPTGKGGQGQGERVCSSPSAPRPAMPSCPSLRGNHLYAAPVLAAPRPPPRLPPARPPRLRHPPLRRPSPRAGRGTAPAPQPAGGASALLLSGPAALWREGGAGEGPGGRLGLPLPRAERVEQPVVPHHRDLPLPLRRLPDLCSLLPPLGLPTGAGAGRGGRE